MANKTILAPSWRRHTCIDRVVPAELQPALHVARRDAETRARALLTASRSGALRAEDILRAKMAVVSGRKWEDGQKVRCRFIDGSAKQRKRAEAKAHMWEEFANIKLAFGNDIDAGFGGSSEGMDPQVNRRDIGSDPLEYAARRIKLSRELWDRLQSRPLKSGESYEMLRRNFLGGLTQVGNATVVASKYVGGVVYVRDHAGSGREPFTPVPVDRQRAALKQIAEGLLSVDSFRLKPEFVRRMTVDQFDRFRDDAGSSAIVPDISLTARMLAMQRSVLDQLMSDAVATRIEESAYRHLKAEQSFRLSELYDTVQDAIWSELKTGRDISVFRRNLQREHLKRVTGVLLRPSQGVQADARALQRENAKQLLALIHTALTKTSFSKEARAHLAECENTLEETLKAPLMRGA